MTGESWIYSDDGDISYWGKNGDWWHRDVNGYETYVKYDTGSFSISPNEDD